MIPGSPAHELVDVPRGTRAVEIASTPSVARGDDRVGEHDWLGLVTAVTAGLLLVLRRPDALLNPGFFADDAPIYSHALAGGSLLTPYAGYLIIPQRAIMALAALAPPAQAPLVTNLVCVAIAIAIAGLIAVRLRQPALALAFVLLPGTMLVLGTLPEIQWVLGVYLLVVLVEPRRVDIIPVALVALQGPVALLLVPLFMVRWWFRRDIGLILLVALIGAAVQVAVISGFPRTVSGEHSEILMDIAWRGLIVPLVGVRLSPVMLPVLAIPVGALLIVTVWRLGWVGLGLVYVWVAFMVGGTILSPYPSRVIWSDLTLTERHFYLVGVAVAAVIVIGAVRRIPSAVALAPLLVLGMVADFGLPAINPDWARASACIKGPVACSVPLDADPGWDVVWTGP